VRPPLRSFPLRLAAIAVLGVILRAVYLFVFARNVKGSGDWYFYHWQAALIAHGHGFSDPWVLLGTHHLRASAIHPPLYPLLLAGVYELGGHGPLAQRSLGLVLGVVTLVLVGLIGRRARGERAGLIAAGLYAVYPLMIAVDGDLMSETLYGPLVAGSLLCALALRAQPRPRTAAGLGALIALAALTRSEALLLVPLLLVPLIMFAPLPGRRRLAMLGCGLAACCIVLAPWTIRNYSVFGRFVPVSTNDATVLAGANCAKAYHGVNLGGWDFTCVPPRTSTNEAVQAARWRSEGLHYLTHHLGRLPTVLAVRLLRVWDLWQPRRQARVFAEGRLVGVEEAGVAAFYVLSLLGLVGARALWRGRRGVLGVLLSPALLVSLSALAGYGIPRLRHTFEIALVVLAAVGALTVAEGLAARRRELAPGPRRLGGVASP
jgi:4-amino-4-deoxy-L-arabinose transferase-like glycosyltransferase